MHGGSAGDPFHGAHDADHDFALLGSEYLVAKPVVVSWVPDQWPRTSCKPCVNETPFAAPGSASQTWTSTSRPQRLASAGIVADSASPAGGTTTTLVTDGTTRRSPPSDGWIEVWPNPTKSNAAAVVPLEFPTSTSNAVPSRGAFDAESVGIPFDPGYPLP